MTTSTIAARMWRQPFAGPTCLPLALSALIYVVLSLMPRELADPWRLLVGAAVFVTQNAVLAATAYHVGRRLATGNGLVEALLIAVLIFFSIPAILVPVLGLLHQLTLAHLVLAAGMLETAVLAALPASGPPRRRIDLSERLRSVSVVETFVVGLTILVLCVLALNGTRYTATGTDEMFYHLPMIAEWAKTQSIAPAASVPAAARGFPGAREAVLAWLSLPMRSDNLALLMLIELPASYLSILTLCRLCSAPRRSSLALAMLWLVTPVVAGQATLQKNDLFLVSGITLCVVFSIRAERTGSREYAVLAGLAGGLVAATKFSGPLYLGVVLALSVVASLGPAGDRWPDPRALWVILKRHALVLVVSVATSAIWYVRNLIHLANPVFPRELWLFGYRLFDGPLSPQDVSHTVWGLDVLGLLGRWPQFLEAFGPAGALLFIAPVALAMSSASRRTRGPAMMMWGVCLPAACLLVYMYHPFGLHHVTEEFAAIRPRYLLPFFAALFASAAVLCAAHRRLADVVLGVSVVGGVVTLASWTRYWWLIASGAACLASARALVRLGRTAGASRVWRRSVAPATAAALSVCAVVAAAGVEAAREGSRRHPGYGYADTADGWGQVSRYVHDNVMNARILVLGSVEKFPLYGRRFSNTLFAPPEYDVQDLNARIFGSHRASLQARPDAVRALIDDYGVEYVVGFRPIIDRHGSRGEMLEFGPAPTAMLRSRYPETFTLVYAANGAELLSVRRPAQGSPPRPAAASSGKPGGAEAESAATLTRARPWPAPAPASIVRPVPH